MKINFISSGSLMLASVRYRAAIPAMGLRALGHKVYVGPNIQPDAEVVVLGKHGDSETYLNQVEKVINSKARLIVDVCDLYSNMPERTGVITWAAERAHAVTSPSQFVLDQVIAKRKHRVLDPYGFSPGVPKPVPDHPHLLWFGHGLNLQGLVDELPRLNGYSVTAVTRADGQPEGLRIIQWTPAALSAAFSETDMTILPVREMAEGRKGPEPALKSANRLVDAIQSGHFVATHSIPSYEELSEYAWVGDIREGVEWARSNPKSALEKVKSGQAYVREHYSPSRIAAQWLEALL